MTIRLTVDKANGIEEACEAILSSNEPKSIREGARVIDKLVASFPQVMYGLLYYRSLEFDKISALTKTQENFEAKMSLPLDSRKELQWWVHNVETAYQRLFQHETLHQITSDALLSVWGGGRMRGIIRGIMDIIRSLKSHKLPRNAGHFSQLENICQE